MPSGCCSLRADWLPNCEASDGCCETLLRRRLLLASLWQFEFGGGGLTSLSSRSGSFSAEAAGFFLSPGFRTCRWVPRESFIPRARKGRGPQFKNPRGALHPPSLPLAAPSPSPSPPLTPCASAPSSPQPPSKGHGSV